MNIKYLSKQKYPLDAATKELISTFNRAQKKLYGYKKYKVRSSIEFIRGTLYQQWYHCIDVYTKSGLLIRTSKTGLNNDEVSLFINNEIDRHKEDQD